MKESTYSSVGMEITKVDEMIQVGKIVNQNHWGFNALRALENFFTGFLQHVVERFDPVFVSFKTLKTRSI